MSNTDDEKPSTDGRLVLGVVELALIVALIPLVVPPLLSLKFSNYLNLSGFAAAGVAWTIVRFVLPDETQKRLLAIAQRLLVSRTAMVVLNTLLVVLIVCGCITKYTFQWTGPDPLKVSVNGASMTLEKQSDSDGYAVDYRLRPAFLPMFLTVDRYSPDFFHREITPKPFDSGGMISIPIFVTTRNITKYRDVEFNLLDTLLQSSETPDHLSRAQNELNAAANLKTEKDAHDRWQKIFQIFWDENSAPNAQSLSDQTQSIVVDLENDYPSDHDPWIVLVTASLDAAKEKYETCLGDITKDYIASVESSGLNEIASTAHFLRGFCHLVYGQTLEHDFKDISESERQLDASRYEFDKAEEWAKKSEKAAEFEDLAVASSRFFKGVSQFYEGNAGQSIVDYSRTFESGPAPMRARAYSAAGFAYFTEGRITEANKLFDEALGVIDGYPKAEINYGFSLMSDPRDYKEAMARFAILLHRDRGPITSSDEALAELGKDHLLELQGESQGPAGLAAAVSQYAALAGRMGIVDDRGTQYPALHYAFLAQKLSSKIYLPPHAFGNEVLALAFECRAMQRIAPISNMSENDQQHFTKIQTDLHRDTETLKKVLNTFWFAHPETGWYESIKNC